MTQIALPAAENGTLLLIPHFWLEHVANGANTRILDEMVEHPLWFPHETTPKERRAWAAGLLVNADSPKWSVWRGGEILGILLLTRVTAGSDAVVHFLFFDRNLVGKRSLLHRFFGYCFAVLGFQRLSVEVPEDADRLIKFYRNFGFRYEGEHRATGLTPIAFLEAGAPGLPPVNNAAQWVARMGSRVEKAFWRDGALIDLLRLRLLKTEWETDASTTDRSSRATYRRGPRRESHRSRPAPDQRPASA